MRPLLTKTFLALAMATIAAFGADNSLGTWKLNVEKSKYTPAPFPLKNLTTTREAADGGVKITSTGVQADGTAINSSNTIKYDGKEYPITGAPWDTASMKQVDANTFTGTQRQKNGKYKGTGRTVISKDGKTLTTTAKGTNADGKPFTVTFVYDKQ